MIAGVILAAGRSSRLGRPKQLLPLHGEPLLRQTVRRVLTSSLDVVLVVIGRHAEAVRAAIADLPVQIVVNPDAAEGQSTSVLAGLAALRQPPDEATADTPSPLGHEVEAVMFLLGDQPGIEPTVIDALIGKWRETRAVVVMPRYNDGMGNPVLFDRSVLAELATLEGDTGAKPVVRARQAAGDLLLVPVDGPAPPDVDTEEDYAALLASLPDNNLAQPPISPLPAHRRGTHGVGRGQG